MAFIKLTDLDLAGKRVLIRADLNVPVKDGKVTSDARITASMPTIEHCMSSGASVMVMSHRGRPEEGNVDEENSMQPIAEDMSAKLGKEVRLVKDYLDNAPEVAAGEVVLLENVRFNAGEKKNDEALSKQYAALCDIYVMDAFGTAHRAQASTHGAGQYAPMACAGPLLAGELEAYYRGLLILTFGGGTNEIQRVVIARDALSRVKGQTAKDLVAVLPEIPPTTVLIFEETNHDLDLTYRFRNGLRLGVGIQRTPLARCSL